MAKKCKIRVEKISVQELLTYSFFLCLSPGLLNWFGLGAPAGRPQVAGWMGFSVLSPLYYLSIALYIWAIWGKQTRRLSMGILAHLLLELSYGIAYYTFPIAAEIGDEVNLALSRSAVQPGFWVAVAGGGLHFLLFLAVEIRGRKVTEADKPPEQ